MRPLKLARLRAPGQMVKPIFVQAAELLIDTPTAALAAVDYENAEAQGIRARIQVTKYPTFKPFRRGAIPLKTEYRDKRAAPDFANFVRNLVSPPVAAVTSAEEVDAHVAANRRAIVAHVTGEDHPALPVFQQVARMLRDDCHFLAHHGCGRPNTRARGVVWLFILLLLLFFPC